MNLERLVPDFKTARVPEDSLLARTLALRSPGASRDLVAELGALDAPEARAALLELASAGEPARLAAEAVQAIAALPPFEGALDALSLAARAPSGLVRIAATRALVAHTAAPFVHDLLAERLLEDPAWICRQSALHGLARLRGEAWWSILGAADDPHWRVRHALVDALLAAEERGEVEADEVDRRLAEHRGAAVDGVRAYLAWRRSDRTQAPTAIPEALDPLAGFVANDPDPVVIARELRAMSAAELRQHVAWMPRVLNVDHDAVRRIAVETLRRHSTLATRAEAMRWLDDPRDGATFEALLRLIDGFDLDRREELSRHLLAMKPTAGAGRLAWAIAEAGATWPVAEEEGTLRALIAHLPRHATPVRRALAALYGRAPELFGPADLDRLLADHAPVVVTAALHGLARLGQAADPSQVRALLEHPSPTVRAAAVPLAARYAPDALPARLHDPVEVRLALAAHLPSLDEPLATILRGALLRDALPLVRAAALDVETAAALVAAPTTESSWVVLEAACRLARCPVWELHPATPPSLPEPSPAPTLPPAEPTLSPPRHGRPLGPDGLLVSPLSISGHYGLPVEGFAQAMEAGVNLFFWEPNYATLSAFMQGLSPARRTAIHLLIGTFEADPAGIRRDVERALRHLRVERLTFFLVFWVRSDRRLDDACKAELDALVREGKVGTWGLSSHDRRLLDDAMNAGIDPVMARHSMAHRGAETTVFPAARALGRRVITFNNTCYGRLLRPHGPHPPATAADCYRYTLAFPEVATCFSAPATLEQLAENLTVLDDLSLSPDRLAALRAHGDSVYVENSIFARCLRWL